MQDNRNPLFGDQREKAGAQTFGKYLYQYHWALYKIISDHMDKNEYAVFIELHEDVVISDSLERGLAKFDFNQVKTTKIAFNTNQLVKLKKKSGSVLGKLISSGNVKPYSNLIKTLNLVSVRDFNLELDKEDVVLKTIRKEDLSAIQLNALEDAIKKELGISELPSNLQFVVSDLQEKNFQQTVIGAIAELINSLFPDSYCNPQEIYRILIDELLRKGSVTYDFTKWDELLKNKALTSIQVSRVISDFTNIKDEASIERQFQSICNELGLKSIESKNLMRSFKRYKIQRIANNSTLQIDTTKFFLELIKKNINLGVTEIKEIIDVVSQSIPLKIKRQFTSNDDFTAAIICEFILSE